MHVGLIGFADRSGEGPNRAFFSNESLSDQEIYEATNQQPGNGVATNYTSAFTAAAKLFENAKKGPIYIIKSTVLPGSTKKLQDKFNELDIVFSPEFLTERNNQDLAINSGSGTKKSEDMD